ncbi:hypothetical protein ACHMXB_22285 (plasmid) [Arthrobacter sp. UC242_113]|uniref:hypothetical protein n=1 Tax=Arthrobacter sp. UC242_113 TaxID=3374550 RepID=UPI003756FA3A
MMIPETVSAISFWLPTSGSNTVAMSTRMPVKSSLRTPFAKGWAQTTALNSIAYAFEPCPAEALDFNCIVRPHTEIVAYKFPPQPDEEFILP